MRKIIQLTTTSVGTSQELQVVVPCDDGSLWKLSKYDQITWTRLPNVPQGIEPTDMWPR